VVGGAVVGGLVVGGVVVVGEAAGSPQLMSNTLDNMITDKTMNKIFFILFFYLSSF